jgi:hypothetical protein
MSVEGRLTEMGFSDAQKLMELKKVINKNAPDLIKRLPDEDHQYERALTLLDKNFQNNIKIAEIVIIDLLSTPKMGNSAQLIGVTYNAMIQAEQMLDGSQSHGYAMWTVAVQRNLRVQIKQQSLMNLDNRYLNRLLMLC